MSELVSRGIAACFYKSAGNRLSLFSMFTMEPVVGHNGQTYISRNFYDVDYSRRYGYVWHLSGCGGSGPFEVDGPYWTSGTIEVVERPTSLVGHKDKPPWRGKDTRAIRKRNRTRRLRKLPVAFLLQPGWDLMDWLVHNAIKDKVIYCSLCHDYLPSNDLCSHCWFCDKTANYSTPDERCKCASREECDDS